jgi:hypothetical protein
VIETGHAYRGYKSGSTSRPSFAVTKPLVFACDNLWTHQQSLLDYLSREYGHCSLDSLGGSYGWPVRYRQIEDYAGLNVTTLAEYIAAFQEGRVRLPYLRHLSLNRALARVRRHLQEPAEFGPNWVAHPRLDRLGGPELFIGQTGTVFGNVHQDQVGVHVGFVQLQGAKEIIVFPPENSPYLYRFAGRQFPFELRNSEVRYADLDNYERFPLLRHATPRRIVLQAGQAMLLPSDWWHTTRNLSDSVSYNVRIINSSNAGRALWRHLQGIPRWASRHWR